VRKPHEIIDCWLQLPRWRKDGDIGSTSRFVSAEYPPFYRKYVSYLAKCPELWKKIEGRFQLIIDTVDFGFDEIVFNFVSDGIAIKVEPGNACVVCPSSSNINSHYTTHNLDRDSYMIGLHVLLSIALDEIYHQMAVWENEDPPTSGIDTDFEGGYWQVRRTVKRRKKS